jgi:hypothetical protein
MVLHQARTLGLQGRPRSIRGVSVEIVSRSMKTTDIKLHKTSKYIK